MSFDRVWETIKAHPAIVLSAVVALILLWQLRSNAGSHAASGSGAMILQPDPNIIAANTQIAIATDALQAHGMDTAAAVTIAQTNAAAATSINQQNTGVQTHALDVTQHAVDVNAASNDLAANLAANVATHNVDVQGGVYGHYLDILGNHVASTDALSAAGLQLQALDQAYFMSQAGQSAGSGSFF